MICALDQSTKLYTQRLGLRGGVGATVWSATDKGEQAATTFNLLKQQTVKEIWLQVGGRTQQLAACVEVVEEMMRKMLVVMLLVDAEGGR